MDSVAHFTRTVSYMCKMFMKLTTGRFASLVKIKNHWNTKELAKDGMTIQMRHSCTLNVVMVSILTYSQHFILFVTYGWAQ